LSESKKYTSVSFPREVVEAVRELIEELKYWPSVSAFAREAVLEKIRRERKALKELKGKEDVEEEKES